LLYADDAAIFVAPVKEDIQNLASILHSFGEVTDLCTNFLKSYVVPIRCGDINLDDILEGIPAARTTFPMRYLGLPLSVWQLKRNPHLERKIHHHGRAYGSCQVGHHLTSNLLSHSLAIPPAQSSSSTSYKEPSYGRLRKQPPAQNAKLIGKQFVDPLNLVVLGSKIWTVRHDSPS
jgi:hypothetical protein